MSISCGFQGKERIEEDIRDQNLILQLSNPSLEDVRSKVEADEWGRTIAKWKFR